MVFGLFKKGVIVYEILRNIVEGGFKGKIILVNLKGGIVEVSGKIFEIREKLDE